MASAVHHRKIFLFGLLSLADLGLTWLLLERGGGTVYESNPVAGWFLASYGWAGLVGFKAASMSLVIGAASLVAMYRPRCGSLVLTFGCSAAAAVVGYSCYLAGVALPADAEPREAMSRLADSEKTLVTRVERGWEYRKVLGKLCADLKAGRCRMGEATERLAASPRARDPEWLRTLHQQYRMRSDADCLATNLVVNCLVPLRRDPAAAERLARRLDRDYRAAFGPARPKLYRRWLTLSGFKVKPSRRRLLARMRPAVAPEG
jgi:hypothetical protein